MKNISLSIVVSILIVLNIQAQSSPLLKAIKKEDWTEARSFIDKKQYINDADKEGFSPLFKLITQSWLIQKFDKQEKKYQEGISLAKRLIDNGADINFISKTGLSILAVSMRLNQNSLTDYLLDKQVTVLPNPLLLLEAIEGNADRVVALYLEKGYPIEGKNIEGFSALHLVAQKGDIALCRQLLDKGALVETKVETQGFFSDMTPLHIAAAYGQNGVVKTLLESGATVTALANYKKTPLHYAVCAPRLEQAYDKQLKETREMLIGGGTLETVRLLQAKNADIHAKDSFGLTPLHWAIYYRQLAIADTLIAWGSTPIVYEHTPDHLFASAFSELWYQIKKPQATASDFTKANQYFEKAQKAYQKKITGMTFKKIALITANALLATGAQYSANVQAKSTGYGYAEYPIISTNDDNSKKKYYKAQRDICEQLLKWCASASTTLPYKNEMLLTVTNTLNVKKRMTEYKN